MHFTYPQGHSEQELWYNISLHDWSYTVALEHFNNGMILPNNDVTNQWTFFPIAQTKQGSSWQKLEIQLTRTAINNNPTRAWY